MVELLRPSLKELDVYNAKDAVINELKNNPGIMDKLVAPILRQPTKHNSDISAGELLARAYGIGREKENFYQLSEDIGLEYTALTRRVIQTLEYTRAVFLSDNPSLRTPVAESAPIAENWIHNAWQARQLFDRSKEDSELKRFLQLPVGSTSNPPSIIYENANEVLNGNPQEHPIGETIETILLRRFGYRCLAPDGSSRQQRQIPLEIAQFLGFRDGANVDKLIDSIMLVANSKLGFSFKLGCQNREDRVFSRGEGILTRYEFNFVKEPSEDSYVNPLLADEWVAHGIHYGLNRTAIAKLINSISLSVNLYGAEPYKEKEISNISASIRTIAGANNRHVLTSELTVEGMSQRNRWEAAAQIRQGIIQGKIPNRRIALITQLMNERSRSGGMKNIGEKLGVSMYILDSIEESIRTELTYSDEGNSFLADLYNTLGVDSWDGLDDRAKGFTMSEILFFYTNKTNTNSLTALEDQVLAAIASGKSYIQIGKEMDIHPFQIGSIFSSHLYGIVGLRNRTTQDIRQEYEFLRDGLIHFQSNHDQFVQYYASADDEKFIRDQQIIYRLAAGSTIRELNDLLGIAVFHSLCRIRAAVYKQTPYFFQGGWE